jgi:hypothetical protein
MSSRITTTQSPPDTEPCSFLDLPAELRNRIYHYTFTPPPGHLEVFDLLEPIHGEALLRKYALEDVTSGKSADDVGRIRHMQANPFGSQRHVRRFTRPNQLAKPYVLAQPHSPQFDAIEALNANELRKAQHVSMPAPVLIPDGKERYLYSNGVWKCSHVHPFPMARHSAANSHPRYAIMTDRCHSLSVTDLANQNVLFADEIEMKWTIFLNLSTCSAANAIKAIGG